MTTCLFKLRKLKKGLVIKKGTFDDQINCDVRADDNKYQIYYMYYI